jgi:hypothetical protein
MRVISVLVVVVQVAAMVSLVVLSLLDVLHLVLNTRMGGVIALSFRGATVHGLRRLSCSSSEIGWFPHGGSRGGSRRGNFGRNDGMESSNPTLEHMARH